MLTAREREVLAAVAEGLTNKEIGQRLFISERTIGVHVSHIFDKLQVRTRVQASAIFLRSPAEQSYDRPPEYVVLLIRPAGGGWKAVPTSPAARGWPATVEER